LANHKRPRDPNQPAKLIVEIATGEAKNDKPTTPTTPAARGRKGGRKGGTARATLLTPEERSQVASKAAKARWSRDVKMLPAGGCRQVFSVHAQAPTNLFRATVDLNDLWE
jgi:hypothetical protein